MNIYYIDDYIKLALCNQNKGIMKGGESNG